MFQSTLYCSTEPTQSRCYLAQNVPDNFEFQGVSPLSLHGRAVCHTGLVPFGPPLPKAPLCTGGQKSALMWWLVWTGYDVVFGGLVSGWMCLRGLLVKYKEMIKAVVLLLLYFVKGYGNCTAGVSSWSCSLNEGSGCCWSNLPCSYSGGQGLQPIYCSYMSVPAVSFGRGQVFAVVGSFPLVFPLLCAVNCTLCTSVPQKPLHHK